MSEKDEIQEQEQEIEKYRSKTEALAAKLDGFRAKKLDGTKEEMMRKAGYTFGQIERYKGHIIGGNEAELSESLSSFRDEIPPTVNYVDPNPMNGARQKPKPVDHEEIGRNMYQKIKHRLRGF